MFRVYRFIVLFLCIVLIASSCSMNVSENSTSIMRDNQLNWSPYYQIEKRVIDAENILDEALVSDGCVFLRYEGQESSPRFFFSYYDNLGNCRSNIDVCEKIENIDSVGLIDVTHRGDICVSGLLYEGDNGDYSPFCAFFSQKGELKSTVRLVSSHLISQLLDLTVLDDDTIILTADCHGQTEFIAFNSDGSSQYSFDLELSNAEIICSNEKILLFDVGNTELYEVTNQEIIKVKDSPSDALDIFACGDKILWANTNGLFELGELDPVIQWDDLNLSGIPKRIQISDSGILYFLTYSMYSAQCSLFKLVPSTKDPYPNKKIITVAGYNLRSDASLMYALETMNEGNPSCHYVLRDYYDEIQGISNQPVSKQIGEKIRLEVASGKTPDIYYDKYRDLDLRDFCKDDYLINLSSFLSGQEDEFNYGVLTLHQETPYVICTDFSINCFSALTETMEGINEWDYDSFYQTFATFDDGSYAQGVYTREDLLYSMLSMDIKKYVNYEKGVCDFHQDSFRELLKWVNDFGASEAWIHCGYPKLKDRTIMLDFEQFNGLRNYLYEKYETQDIVWVGYPNAPGELPYSARNIYAISALSPYVDESWEFIEFVLSDECQSLVTDNPVRNSALYQKMEEEFNSYAEANTSISDESKEELFREYDDILHQAIVCDNFMSTEIYDIVCEEANPYFYGDRSLEECIDLIETRAKIYISEVI